MSNVKRQYGKYDRRRKVQKVQNPLINLEGLHYCVIPNIQPQLNSTRLREFFREFVERRGFYCFHYRNRPSSHPWRGGFSFSAIAAFESERKQQAFIRKYDQTYWPMCSNGIALLCTIKPVKVVEKCSENSTVRVRGRPCKSFQGEIIEYEMRELEKMSEFRPPHCYPNGNVGTPSDVIQEQIRNCSFPTHLLKTLNSRMKKEGKRKGKYGNVPFNYSPNVKTEPMDDSEQDTSDSNEDDDDEDFKKVFNTRSPSHSDYDDDSWFDQDFRDNGDVMYNGRGESFVEHEAVTSDVTSQRREKERLFEEEIEQKWEKGGSGLVYYTEKVREDMRDRKETRDAQYWKQQEGDFDEQTADNFNVDMQEYYGQQGDRDAKDFIRIQEEKRLRDGHELYPEKERIKNEPSTSMDYSWRKSVGKKHHNNNRVALKNPKNSNKPAELGDFEQHTKEIGAKILSKYGWSRENPLIGINDVGLVNPVEHWGQFDRSCIGYQADEDKSRSKNSRRRSRQKKRREGWTNQQQTNQAYPSNSPLHHDPSVSVATKIMESQGWTPQNPRLGPDHNKGLHEPIQHWGQQSKKGLGFEMVTRANKKKMPKIDKVTHNTKYMDAIPNFAMATFNNGTVAMQRHKLVPGDDDGVVITTSFDERPLDVDLPVDVTRQPQDTAVKYRKEYLENNEKFGEHFKSRRGNLRGRGSRGGYYRNMGDAHNRGFFDKNTPKLVTKTEFSDKNKGISQNRDESSKLVGREAWKFMNDENIADKVNQKKMEKAMKGVSFVNGENNETDNKNNKKSPQKNNDAGRKPPKKSYKAYRKNYNTYTNKTGGNLL